MRLRRDSPIWVIGPLLLYMIIRCAEMLQYTSRAMFGCIGWPHLLPNVIKAMSNIARLLVVVRSSSMSVEHSLYRQTFKFGDRTSGIAYERDEHMRLIFFTPFNSVSIGFGLKQSIGSHK